MIKIYSYRKKVAREISAIGDSRLFSRARILAVTAVDKILRRKPITDTVHLKISEMVKFKKSYLLKQRRYRLSPIKPTNFTDVLVALRLPSPHRVCKISFKQCRWINVSSISRVPIRQN